MTETLSTESALESRSGKIATHRILVAQMTEAAFTEAAFTQAPLTECTFLCFMLY